MKTIENEVTATQTGNADDSAVNLGYEAVRYNALQHGILSRLVVLPHEDFDEYTNLLTSLVEEHNPSGITEHTLIEELAAIIWRKRRVLLAEGSKINQDLKIAVKNPERIIPAAAPFQSNLLGQDMDLREIMITTPSENAENQQYATLDLMATHRARKILYKGGANAYEKARRALHKDSRNIWDENVEEGTYKADAEGLETWIREWLLPYCHQSDIEARHQPAIKAQALGEGLQAHRLENLIRYETHLDRKFERTLGMLLKIKEMRGRK